MDTVIFRQLYEQAKAESTEEGASCDIEEILFNKIILHQDADSLLPMYEEIIVLLQLFEQIKAESTLRGVKSETEGKFLEQLGKFKDTDGLVTLFRADYSSCETMENYSMSSLSDEPAIKSKFEANLEIYFPVKFKFNTRFVNYYEASSHNPVASTEGRAAAEECEIGIKKKKFYQKIYQRLKEMFSH